MSSKHLKSALGELGTVTGCDHPSFQLEIDDENNIIVVLTGDDRWCASDRSAMNEISRVIRASLITSFMFGGEKEQVTNAATSIKRLLRHYICEGKLVKSSELIVTKLPAFPR